MRGGPRLPTQATVHATHLRAVAAAPPTEDQLARHAVAEARHGFDHGVAELVADPRDVHLDGVARPVALDAECKRVEIALRNRTAGVHGQGFQNRPLARCKTNASSVHERGPCVEIEIYLAK